MDTAGLVFICIILFIMLGVVGYCCLKVCSHEIPYVDKYRKNSDESLSSALSSSSPVETANHGSANSLSVKTLPRVINSILTTSPSQSLQSPIRKAFKMTKPVEDDETNPTITITSKLEQPVENEQCKAKATADVAGCKRSDFLSTILTSKKPSNTADNKIKRYSSEPLVLQPPSYAEAIAICREGKTH